MKKHLTLLIIVAMTVALFTGCASGPNYRSVATTGALTPHKGNGMVLIYWLPGIVGCANPGTPLLANNVPLSHLLPRGSFYSYEAAPGPVNIAFPGAGGTATTGQNVAAFATGGIIGVIAANQHVNGFDVNINVLPDQTYYIEAGFSRLHQVSTEEGERDIRKCRWINAPGR